MLDYPRKRMAQVPGLRYLRSLYRRFGSTSERHPLQNLKADRRYRLTRLGTEYGGWTFVDTPGLHRATIVSAGLGEDASFDVEFARKYAAKVILVDPTPRAIAHFAGLLKNLGRRRDQRYVPGGNQPIGAYDLRGLSATDFTLVPKALWDSCATLRFFSPTNKEHVSHSIVNRRPGDANTVDFIEVESTTLTEILGEFGFGSDQLQLLKLDIEGAEIEVIAHMLDEAIRPKQILVEFDQLNDPSVEGYHRVDFAHHSLTDHGYKCIWTDGQADFLYVGDDLQY